MLDIRVIADPAEQDEAGHDVEVRLTLRRRPDEDPLEDSRLFASGDPGRIAAFVAEALRRYGDALPGAGPATCGRCDRVGDPDAANERRRPFVCAECQAEASRAPVTLPAEAASDGPGVEVRFLGTGDAFGSGGRRQAAILLRALDGPAGVLLDAGPGCHAALRAEGLSSRDLAAVILSHFHGDHYGGLPFLELDSLRRAERRRLPVLAPVGAEARLGRLRECLYPGLPENAAARVTEVLPGEAAPFPAEAGPGHARALAAIHQPDAWALSWKLRLGGRTIVYSGDTEFNERLLSEAADADLLIHECSALEPITGTHVIRRTP